MNRKDRIEQLLTKNCSPLFLSIDDESSNHHVPKGAQTHFKIIMACKEFISLSRIQRHRMINNVLKNEFTQGMHALSMHLYTPDEWEPHINDVLSSPSCKDGYKNN